MSLYYRLVMLLTIVYLSVITATASTVSANDNQFQLNEATIHSVHQAMANHQLSCVLLVNDYISHIQQYDLDMSRGAPINAITEINPSVLNEAQALDQYYQIHHQFVGPLHCIPVIIKDNIDSFDDISTSGSLALLGTQPIKDAFIVNKMRAAGAIILGKGAMDEFAAGMSGISSRTGRVGNAYDPTQNPGGSSAGVAAAVSANFCMVGIGTDNSGSIRVPASFNGDIGLRPSTGLISQTGIFPRGNMDGVAGPISRNVEDLAIVLSVIAKPDPTDNKTLSAPRINDYASFMKANGLQGKRIGIIQSVVNLNSFTGMDPNIVAIYQNTFKHLEEQGVTLINIDLPQFNVDRSNNMAGEIEDVNAYLSSFPATRKNYNDICHSGYTLAFGTEKDCLNHIINTPKKNSDAYVADLKVFNDNRQYIENIMQQNHLDALLIPISVSGVPTYHADQVNTWKLPVSSNSGLPSITLIAGYSADNIPLPVGFELVGQMYGEADLINIAYAYEKKIQARVPPTLLHSAQPLSSLHKTVSLIGLSIPQMNNVFSLLGYTSYQQVLKNNKPEALTSALFKKIVASVLNAQ